MHNLDHLRGNHAVDSRRAWINLNLDNAKHGGEVPGGVKQSRLSRRLEAGEKAQAELTALRKRCGELAATLETYARRPERPHADNRTDMVYGVMYKLADMAKGEW